MPVVYIVIDGDLVKCALLWFHFNKLQWRSQDIADARAQHGHTTFVRISARIKCRSI